MNLSTLREVLIHSFEFEVPSSQNSLEFAKEHSGVRGMFRDSRKEFYLLVQNHKIV